MCFNFLANKKERDFSFTSKTSSNRAYCPGKGYWWSAGGKFCLLWNINTYLSNCKEEEKIELNGVRMFDELVCPRKGTCYKIKIPKL